MKKVLLIGLDGATFSILDPMIKDGRCDAVSGKIQL